MNENQKIPDLVGDIVIHVIGIGGAGMAPIAQVLNEMGHTVQGSDVSQSDVLAALEGSGVSVSYGQKAENVTGKNRADYVVRSTAIPDTNPEVIAAVEQGQAVQSRSNILAAICSKKRTVAVAGTHGKTTTSSMLASISLAVDKTGAAYIIGGKIKGTGSSAAWGDGDWFVVEADESDGTFLNLGHEIGICTNIEPDHLEHYGGEEGLRSAFATFVENSSTAIVCADDDGASVFCRQPNVISYGTCEDADIQMTNIVRTSFGTEFDLERNGKVLVRIAIAMPGMHNARNAAAAALAALEMKIDPEIVAVGLASFQGVGRRFDRRGQVNGIDLVDDYAHLPTEVHSAVEAARHLGNERVVAVFQPHRYSRTQSVGADFGESFDEADVVWITGIYASGEAPRPGVSGKIVYDAVVASRGSDNVHYVEERNDVAALVAAELRPGDVCLSMGAGDLVALPDEILATLDSK